MLDEAGRCCRCVRDHVEGCRGGGQSPAQPDTATAGTFAEAAKRRGIESRRWAGGGGREHRAAARLRWRSCCQEATCIRNHAVDAKGCCSRGVWSPTNACFKPAGPACCRGQHTPICEVQEEGRLYVVPVRLPKADAALSIAPESAGGGRLRFADARKERRDGAVGCGRS